VPRQNIRRRRKAARRVPRAQTQELASIHNLRLAATAAPLARATRFAQWAMAAQPSEGKYLLNLSNSLPKLTYSTLGFSVASCLETALSEKNTHPSQIESHYFVT
jgi:hypothetical protein